MERRRVASAPHCWGPWILWLLPALAGGQHLPGGDKEVTVTGVRGRAVELSCGTGPVEPSVVFWSFAPGATWPLVTTGPPRAVAASQGREVMVAPGAGTLGRVTLRAGTLELRELRAGAQGRFLCQGLFPERGRQRLGYHSVLLRVLVPVSKPFVQPSAAAVAEGTAVALSCAVREGTEPLSFSWQHREPRGGPSVSPPLGTVGARAELNLAPANRSHLGWYVCTVGNQVNSQASEPIYLDIVYGPDAPAITVEPFSPETGGFSAGEREDVVLSCRAPSNPPSRYVWLHNGSQVHVGQTYVMAAIARAQAGTYTCLAENPHLQTRTQASVVLTVYYPPAGSPSCSATATTDLRAVALRCHWPGGFPLAELRWVGLVPPGDNEEVTGTSVSMATSIQPGAATSNGSSFSCLASHPALPRGAVCGITLWVPAGGPSCVVAATKGDEYVMLRCRWEGGTPAVTLRWRDAGGHFLGDPSPSVAVLVLSTGGSLRGRDFICAAAHPLRAGGAECRLRLDVPVLEAESSEVVVLEGDEARLACRRHGGDNLGATMAWYDPREQEVTAGMATKYHLERGRTWLNLTVADAEWPRDAGTYRCAAANTVGSASLAVRLRVERYPAPPNVTISKLRYTRARTEVRLQWRTHGTGNLTGFVVQRRPAKKLPRRVAGLWETAAGDIEPESRDRRLGGLDPAVLYAFRVLAVNHRTAGHPSEVQTPGEVGGGTHWSVESSVGFRVNRHKLPPLWAPPILVLGAASSPPVLLTRGYFVT
ncbi:hypothetical protein Q9966_014550 [Columba livia]|nr:hypothetical protein Q9966_014550 [Columba livia]